MSRTSGLLLAAVLGAALLSCRGAGTPTPSASSGVARSGLFAGEVPAAPQASSPTPTPDPARGTEQPAPVLDRARVLPSSRSYAPVTARRAASRITAEAEVFFPPSPVNPLGIEVAAGLVAEDDELAIGEIEEAEPSSGSEPPQVTSDMPIVVNRLVEAYIALYRGPKRGVFLRGMGRCGRYREMIAEVLAEEGLPADLIYLAMVESAFNPTAVSKAGACGLWQFIPGTGRLYDLTVNWWLDERFEVTKATRAAARHLRDLYAEFGDWYLAMASYNAGAGRVRRAIAKAGTRDFWRLPLPSETRNYVPAFIAAVIVGKDPERFGLFPDSEPCLATETVTVPEGTDLGVIAGVGEIGRLALQEMNPHLKRGCVPPGVGEYPVTVPAGMGEKILAGLAQIPEELRLTWGRYLIARGDTLWSVARKTGVPVEVIREVNGLKKNASLKAGAELKIPKTRAVAVASATEVTGPSEGRSIVHRVRSGETLWGIARRYGVTVKDLQSVNRLNGSALAAGQRLVVARAGRAGAPEAGANYLIRAGDTLTAIASRHGVSVTALMEANGLSSESILRPGVRLVIPARSRG